MPGKRVPTSASTILERSRRSQPLLIRSCKVRPAFTRKRKTKADTCHSMEMTIPSEVARMAGIRTGDTMLVEGYADGFWVRKGGDLMSAEDRDL